MFAFWVVTYGIFDCITCDFIFLSLNFSGVKPWKKDSLHAQQCRRFPGACEQSNRRVENGVFEADGCPGGGRGGGVLKEFLGGDLPLGPWNP